MILLFEVERCNERREGRRSFRYKVKARSNRSDVLPLLRKPSWEVFLFLNRPSYLVTATQYKMPSEEANNNQVTLDDPGIESRFGNSPFGWEDQRENYEINSKDETQQSGLSLDDFNAHQRQHGARNKPKAPMFTVLPFTILGTGRGEYAGQVWHEISSDFHSPVSRQPYGWDQQHKDYEKTSRDVSQQTRVSLDDFQNFQQQQAFGNASLSTATDHTISGGSPETPSPSMGSRSAKP